MSGDAARACFLSTLRADVGGVDSRPVVARFADLETCPIEHRLEQPAEGPAPGRDADSFAQPVCSGTREKRTPTRRSRRCPVSGSPAEMSVSGCEDVFFTGEEDGEVRAVAVRLEDACLGTPLAPSTPRLVPLRQPTCDQVHRSSRHDLTPSQRGPRSSLSGCTGRRRTPLFRRTLREISRATPAEQRGPAIDLAKRQPACRFRPRQSRRSQPSRH